MRTRPLVCLGLFLGVGASSAQTPTPPADTHPVPASMPLLDLPVRCPQRCPDRPAPVCQQSTPDGDPQFWASADYLLWWVKKAPLPPVVTTGPFDPDTFVPGVTPSPGAIGSPGTAVLRGGPGVGLGTFSGMRLRAGYWLDPERTVGVEAGAFLLERGSASYTANSDATGVPLLKVPFFDTFTGRESGANAAFTNDAGNLFGGLAGGISIVTSLRLWGADLATAFRVYDDKIFRVDLLVGARYLDLDESVRITQTSSPVGQPLFGGFLGNDVSLGSTITSMDLFHTRNQFYGGTLGGRASVQLFERLGMSVMGRVGLGVTEERSAAGGLSTLAVPGLPTLTAQGGTLAVQSNSGISRSSNFAVVPEANINLHYQVTSCLTATVGYSALYWSSVVRPGDQIDHNLDSRQIPTGQNFTPGVAATSPASQLKRTDFWANGVNFGLAFQF